MNHVKQLTELPINYKRSFFMNGEWREGQGGVFNAIDPATGEIVAELTAATVDDVNAAITREKQIKSWNRNRKITLIEANNRDWEDLAADWTNP